ncbi:hypothetical protein [Nocardia sp. NPDC051570]|uniref:hypothetical protein n=1 Tax=Nocardia sp. NPDC051570 TaxID=3364324 RepID=UPI0037881902
MVDHVAERILALGDHRLAVGVDGFTASGKTSFGHELAERIARAGRPVLRASLDDFKNPWRDRHLYDRESGEGYYRNAFDYPRLRALLLEPFGPNGSGECSLCAIDPLTQIDHSSVRTTAAADAVLIVDGVFAFRPEINQYWDFRIWLEVSAEISVCRGTVRDNDEAIHRERYLPAERIYLAEVQPVRSMDVVIDNSTFANPLLI